MDNKLKFIVDNTPIPALTVYENGCVANVNDKLVELAGEQCLNEDLHLNLLFDIRTCKNLANQFTSQDKLISKVPKAATLIMVKSKPYLHVELSWKKVSSDNGDAWLILVYCVDKYKNRISSLTLQASKDELTGINNRRSFYNKFDEEIRKAKRQKRTVSLMLIDIDHFKGINDTYGHYVGDLVLKELSKEISRILRDSDVFARLGGDEFAILMPETKISEAKEVAKRIQASIDEALLNLDGHQLKLSVSIGVASASELNIDRKVLFETSDSALYKAKFAGRNVVKSQELGVA